MSQLLAPAEDLVSAMADPAEQISGLVRLHVRRHAIHRDLCQVGDTEIRSLSRSRMSRVVALRDAYQQLWEDAIAEGVRRGAFAVPDVKLATLALLEMCTGVARWYSPRGRLSLDEICDAYVEMAMAMLAGVRVLTASRKNGS
jgi:hypothetical protein